MGRNRLWISNNFDRSVTGIRFRRANAALPAVNPMRCINFPNFPSAHRSDEFISIPVLVTRARSSRPRCLRCNTESPETHGNLQIRLSTFDLKNAASLDLDQKATFLSAEKPRELGANRFVRSEAPRADKLELFRRKQLESSTRSVNRTLESPRAQQEARLARKRSIVTGTRRLHVDVLDFFRRTLRSDNARFSISFSF